MVFDESTYKHLDLFEKKVDVNLKSAVKIELDNETIIINYKNEDYQYAINGEENLGERSHRCYDCYKLRLEKTAIKAKKLGFDYFTTSLSISPYKVSKWINEIGFLLEDKYKISFLYSDFKKEEGYKESIKLSKEYNLYRQDYCGCLYSKKERDEKKCQED